VVVKFATKSALSFAGLTLAIDIEKYLNVACGPANPIDVQTIVSGAAIDPRSIRALSPVTDGVYVDLQKYKTVACGPANPVDIQVIVSGAAIDPRSIRALTNADVVTAELSKWIGSTAPTVGQKTMANSLPVAIASDQSAVAVTVPIPSAVGTLADLTGNSGAQQLIAASTACKAVLIRALAANTGNARVGDSNVSASRGAEIAAGDSVVLSIDNVNKVYFYAVSPDKVSITYVN